VIIILDIDTEIDKIRVITGYGISIRFRSNINNAKVLMIVSLKSFIFIAILRGNLGKSIAKRSTSSIENCSHSEMNGRLIAPGFVFPRVQCSAPYAQKEGRKMNSRRKTAAKHSSSSSSSSSGILLLMDV
jgi:hypothetical protein